MWNALHWGRWEEALRRANWAGRGVSPVVVARVKAQALAGLGRLDEALRVVKPFGDGRTVPEWFYRMTLADVLDSAHRYDEAIAQLEEGVDAASDNATLLLSLARRVLTHERDVGRARALLDEARAHAMSDLLAPFADLQEGLILVEEGRPHEALAVLEPVLEVFRARRHMPLGELPVEGTMIGLALAKAALGESDEALRLYAKARPRLVALGSPNLDRYDRAIGWP